MEYKIVGGELPAVICTLNNGETMITESGGMSWMSEGVQMQTQGTGGMGKSLGRMFAGDSIFQNKYTSHVNNGEIAFSSSFPGQILAIDVSKKDIVAQKAAFLAAEESVELSVFFRKKIGVGLFGGEGFIMQKLSGKGIAFIEIDGSAIEYDLKEGETKIIDTGYIAYMDATCTMDIQAIKGVKNIFLGGEGLFNTIVTGPGKLVLQTMPLYQVANVLARYLHTGK